MMSGHRIGIVQRAYLSDTGTPVADVIDEYGGVYVGVRYLGLGGGGGDISPARLYVPPATDGRDVSPDESNGAEVLLSMPVRRGGWPVIVGTFHNGQADGRLKARESAADAATDFPRANGPDDLFLEAGGARLVVSSDGDILLDTSASGQAMRLQLGGQLRISRGGDSSEGVLLSGPALTALATLADKINSIGSRLAAVEVALIGASVAGDAAVATAPVAPNVGYAAFSKTAQAALGSAFTPASAPGDEIVANSVTIPAASKGDKLP